jgi:hypothetical protein
MRKMVSLQISLAIISFIIVAWVYFKERPQVEVNSDLRQQLNAVSEQNKQLTEAATVVAPASRRQSRADLREGVNLVHQHQYEQAIALYDKALQAFPDGGWPTHPGHRSERLVFPGAASSPQARVRV